MMKESEREAVAWRNGRYFYCLTHSTTQVIEWEWIYEGDENLWTGRQCDWCGKDL